MIDLSRSIKVATPRKKPEDKLKTGRPTKYSPEMVDLICDRVAVTSDGMATLCKKHDDMPNQETIREWEWKYPEFSARFQVALQHQQRYIMDSCEQDLRDIIMYNDAQGNARVDAGSVALQKAKVEHKRWQAVRLDKKRYGDRTIEAVEQKTDEALAELKKVTAKLDEKNKKAY